MSDIKYETPKEKIDSDEILDLVFKDSSVKHGLQEFSKAILHKVKMFEKEQGRFYGLQVSLLHTAGNCRSGLPISRGAEKIERTSGRGETEGGGDDRTGGQ